VLVSFPLLIIPLAIYNMIVFLTPPDNGWATSIIQIQLPSGEQWTVTFGDGLILVALLLLFIEVAKAARPYGRSVVDHLLSIVVLAIAVAELVMVKQAATSTFALLGAICLVDFLSGLAIRVRAASRAQRFERRIEQPTGRPVEKVERVDSREPVATDHPG
jgi:hypothetical protein